MFNLSASSSTISLVKLYFFIIFAYFTAFLPFGSVYSIISDAILSSIVPYSGFDKFFFFICFSHPLQYCFPLFDILHCVYNPLFWRNAWQHKLEYSPLYGIGNLLFNTDTTSFSTFSTFSFFSFLFSTFNFNFSFKYLIPSSSSNEYFFDNISTHFFIIFFMFFFIFSVIFFIISKSSTSTSTSTPSSTPSSTLLSSSDIDISTDFDISTDIDIDIVLDISFVLSLLLYFFYNSFFSFQFFFSNTFFPIFFFFIIINIISWSFFYKIKLKYWINIIIF